MNEDGYTIVPKRIDGFEGKCDFCKFKRVEANRVNLEGMLKKHSVIHNAARERLEKNLAAIKVTNK